MNKQRWFLPTNTENLELFLSKGLITCASGLNKAYLKDIMSDYPVGYVPFVTGEKLLDGINKSLEEDENLTPCIIELDLSQISKGKVDFDVVEGREREF